MVDVNGVATIVLSALTQPLDVRLDRVVARAPYASEWFVAGSGRERPAAPKVRVEVPATGPGEILAGSENILAGTTGVNAGATDRTDIAALVAVVAAARTAVRIVTPLWSATVHGLKRVQPKHMDGDWYQVDLQWVASGVLGAPAWNLELVSEGGLSITSETGTVLETERGY